MFAGGKKLLFFKVNFMQLMETLKTILTKKDPGGASETYRKTMWRIAKGETLDAVDRAELAESLQALGKNLETFQRETSLLTEIFFYAPRTAGLAEAEKRLEKLRAEKIRFEEETGPALLYGTQPASPVVFAGDKVVSLQSEKTIAKRQDAQAKYAGELARIDREIREAESQVGSIEYANKTVNEICEFIRQSVPELDGAELNKVVEGVNRGR